MELSEDYIVSIVNNINEKNIVPVIGPNVLYVNNGSQRESVQQYVVRRLLQDHFPDESTEKNCLEFANGIKGMTRLGKLFEKNRKSINSYLYQLYKDEHFLSLIKIDEDVLTFLQFGNFPLILTTINYNFLETKLTFHGRSYNSVSYKKEKVKNNPNQDIILKEDKHEIASPAIFHLFGSISVINGTSVVTENDFLSFLHCLHDTNTQPENLKEYLKAENNKYLLTLGCDIPDWTFRFLLYSLKANKDGIQKNIYENLFVGGAIDAHLSEDIAEFLLDIGYYTGNQINEFLKAIIKHLSPIEKPKVFLSVVSREYDTVGEQLYQILSSRFEVWFYKYDGDSHQYWNNPERGIEAGLKNSDFILPVITPYAIDKVDEYEVPTMPNDDTPGLIEEWIRAKNNKIKCCPLYIGRDEHHLKKAIKASNCSDLLWSFFFSEEGNAGLVIDFNTFSAEDLYYHLENHLKK